MLSATVLWLLVGCGDPGIEVHDRRVGAACGRCVFHIPEASSCFWAVDIDGTFYPVGGVHPPDDMITAHDHEGMCAVERQAVVDGSIRPDGRFVATRFELLPYDGTGRTAIAPTH